MKKVYENYLSVQKPHYPQIIQNPASTIHRSIGHDANEKWGEQIEAIGKAIGSLFGSPTHMSYFYP
ncbi:hypothetical protein ASM33_01360 [Wolbachia endosymbiont of Folsomia candida]|nr:hypothetical protein ASM33_01360 [Wolbachia endosymbiont of Folsomia candida]